MRILIWLPGGFWPAIGGVESFTATLATGLIAAGDQVFVFSFQTEKEYFEHEILHGVEIFRFPSALIAKGEEQLYACKKIHSIIQKISPDVLHMQYTINANLIYYSLLSRYLNIPLMITTHGLLCSESTLTYQQLVKKAYAVVCVSHYLYRESLKYAGAAEKTHWIYNGLTMNSGAFVPPTFNPPRFLCLGRMTYEKGYDVAIRAFASFIKQYPQSELILIGDGNLRLQWMQLSADLGLACRVQWLSALNQEECFEQLKTASAVLIPSSYESFGLVAIEAGMWGRPVIASCVGGLPEIIRSQETGALIAANDPDALFRAMCDLCADEEVAQYMGENAYHHVRLKFSSEEMISKYKKLYAWSKSDAII